MTSQEELRAIADVHLALIHLQRALLAREAAEKDVTDRDLGTTSYFIQHYRQRWNELRHAFAALSRD